MPGRKKDQEWLKLQVCSNESETEKIPLTYIGDAFRPRCFKKRTVYENWFDYWENKNAWMKMVIFFEWLQWFDFYNIRIAKDRRVLLVLDNFSGHASEVYLPPISAFIVAFLPPRTASRLNSMDVGKISSFKSRFRTVQYSCSFDSLDDGVSNVYNIYQLTAMKYIK